MQRTLPHRHARTSARLAIASSARRGCTQRGRPSWRQARELCYCLLLPCDHGVVQAVMRQPRMTLQAGVAKRRIFVSAECENGLVHLLGVEHLELHEQVEVLHRQASDSQEQLRLKLGNDVLQG